MLVSATSRKSMQLNLKSWARVTVASLTFMLVTIGGAIAVGQWPAGA